MKRRSLLLLLFVALAVPALARRAAAQGCPNNAPMCVSTDGRIIIAPPAASTQAGDEARARAEAEARARAEAEARARAEYEARMRAQLQAEIARVERWRVYFGWKARVAMEVEAKAAFELQAAAEANAARSYDRWASTPLPALGPHPDRFISFPRAELAPVTFCAAVFTGRDLPSYKGACSSFRYRFDDSWSLLFDGSFVFERYRDADFHSLGLHPALAYSFAEGRGRSAGSHAFVRAGGDVQLPVSGGPASPDAYVGGHVGLGAHVQAGDLVGLGVELRGLVRGGTSAADDGAARARLGAELRVNLLSFAW